MSATAFSLYGYETLVAVAPKAEFERYGLPHMRWIVGVLQLVGAAGVVVGLSIRPIGALAALGLTIMMLMGLTVRVRIEDPPQRMVPAASLATLNLALVVMHVTNF